MRRREFALSLVSGIASWSFAPLPRPAEAQIGLPRVGSNLAFALTAPDGIAVTEQTYRGKWLVIYFGYTFCPDVCPTTMMEIAGALKALGSRADAVQAIFITVDPATRHLRRLERVPKIFRPAPHWSNRHFGADRCRRENFSCFLRTE